MSFCACCVQSKPCKSDGTACPCPQVPNAEHQGPKRVDLTTGTKYLCRCGLSTRFPACDGSHIQYNKDNNTNVQPLKVDEASSGKQAVYVCMCGPSKNMPFCDGNGTHCSAADVNQEAPVAEAGGLEAGVQAVSLNEKQAQPQAQPQAQAQQPPMTRQNMYQQIEVG